MLSPALPIHQGLLGSGSAKELGNTTFHNGRDALKAVAEPMGAWNWVFLSCGVTGDDPAVVAGGIGSVEEMSRCYEDHPEDAVAVRGAVLRVGQLVKGRRRASSPGVGYQLWVGSHPKVTKGPPKLITRRCGN